MNKELSYRIAQVLCNLKENHESYELSRFHAFVWPTYQFIKPNDLETEKLLTKYLNNEK